MKIVGTIARYLLGLMFLVFGPNMFLHFLPMPLPSGQAGQFLVILTTTLLMSLARLWSPPGFCCLRIVMSRWP